MKRDAAIPLFSYGTLQLASVQQEKYGRLLDGVADALPGYRIQPIDIDDADVVRLSGKSRHPIARHTGDPGDRIAGIVYLLTELELAATDAYEVEPYVRVEVTLLSGLTAFAYVLAG
jgi:hypothetical protein